MNQRGEEPMVNIGLRIDKDTKEALYQIAEAKRRRPTDYIRILLEDAVKAEKEKGTI